jgi:subtilase family serine protease
VYGFGENVKGGVWGAGGGVSSLWPKPDYQAKVTTGSTTYRSVPDVGMQVGGCPGGIAELNAKTGFCTGGDNPANGDGNTDRSAVVVGIAVGQGGGFYGFIGTSVSSPEFAGAMALLIEQRGRMGNLNTYLYQIASVQAAKGPVAKFFRTGIPGNNGVIPSNVSPTYSVSTGVGTPVVKALVGVNQAQAAGIPQTPSNP